MGKISNETKRLEQFEKFKRVIKESLRNSGLKKLSPMFLQPCPVLHIDQVRITFPIVREPEPMYHPNSTWGRPLFIAPPEKDLTVATWFSWSKHGVVIRRVSELGEYAIMRLVDVPFYIRLFFEAAKEAFDLSTVFISDGLPYELTIYVYLQRSYMGSKQEDLLEMAEHLVGPVDEETKRRILRESLSRSFNEIISDLLKLSKQDIQVDLSYCLTCGVIVEKDKKFCNSSTKQRIKNHSNCRNKFRAWLNRRANIKSAAEQGKASERLYRELQSEINSRPFSAFETLQNNHPKIYTPKPPGPKPRPKVVPPSKDDVAKGYNEVIKELSKRHPSW